jgi:hypothetical protein
MSIFENFVTDYPQYRATLNESSLKFLTLPSGKTEQLAGSLG